MTAPGVLKGTVISTQPNVQLPPIRFEAVVEYYPLDPVQGAPPRWLWPAAGAVGRAAGGSLLWRASEAAIEASQRPRSPGSSAADKPLRSTWSGAVSGRARPVRYPARSDSRYDMVPPTCRPDESRAKCPFHRIGRV